MKFKEPSEEKLLGTAIKFERETTRKEVLDELEKFGKENKGYYIAPSIPVKEFKKKINSMRENND